MNLTLSGIFSKSARRFLINRNCSQKFWWNLIHWSCGKGPMRTNQLEATSTWGAVHLSSALLENWGSSKRDIFQENERRWCINKQNVQFRPVFLSGGFEKRSEIEFYVWCKLLVKLIFLFVFKFSLTTVFVWAKTKK